MTDDWQTKVDAVWADSDRLGDQGVMDAMDALAADALDPALALFERGGSRDSGGRPDEAAHLYREALALGLPDDERAQCTIQLASTMRNLGRPEETLALLHAEFDGRPESPYAGAAAATSALALATLGQTTEALVTALHGLANTLPRYQRSMHAYADALLVE